MCEYAGMSVTPMPGRRPSPDDLLVLLAVARAGRYTAAATELGLNHTTIARRIGSLEDALGGLRARTRRLRVGAHSARRACDLGGRGR